MGLGEVDGSRMYLAEELIELGCGAPSSLKIINISHIITIIIVVITITAAINGRLLGARDHTHLFSFNLHSSPVNFCSSVVFSPLVR